MVPLSMDYALFSVASFSASRAGHKYSVAFPVTPALPPVWFTGYESSFWWFVRHFWRTFSDRFQIARMRYIASMVKSKYFISHLLFLSVSVSCYRFMLSTLSFLILPCVAHWLIGCNQYFSKSTILGDVLISLIYHWVGQLIRKLPLVIYHVCCHPGSILATAERFVGPDQIVAGHADGKLGLLTEHLTGWYLFPLPNFWNVNNSCNIVESAHP